VVLSLHLQRREWSCGVQSAGAYELFLAFGGGSEAVQDAPVDGDEGRLRFFINLFNKAR